MRRRRRSWLVLTVALSFCAVCAWMVIFRTTSRGYDAIGHPPTFLVSKVVPDDRPRFKLDASQSWRLEFGRGSGMQGLDTVALDQNGQLSLHRRKWEPVRDESRQRWETTSAQLSREDVVEILESIEANDLLNLAQAYHADVFDGTQWILWVQQGGQEKAVYFDNHFPDSILRFADRLDEIIIRSVGPALRWRGASGDHQRGLWDSIRE